MTIILFNREIPYAPGWMGDGLLNAPLRHAVLFYVLLARAIQIISKSSKNFPRFNMIFERFRIFSKLKMLFC